MNTVGRVKSAFGEITLKRGKKLSHPSFASSPRAVRRTVGSLPFSASLDVGWVGAPSLCINAMPHTPGMQCPSGAATPVE